jgi:hypothetical protein
MPEKRMRSTIHVKRGASITAIEAIGYQGPSRPEFDAAPDHKIISLPRKRDPVATLIDASLHICSALSASIFGGLLRGFMNMPHCIV